MSKPNICLELPINSVSFGFVAINILREIYSRGWNITLFPIGQPDLTSFDGQFDQDFFNWLQSGINRGMKSHKRSNPILKLWHINGAMQSYSEKQNLLTFHELNQLTDVEINILNNQNKVFVTSEFSKKVFEIHGVNNVFCAPLGFDNHSFKRIEKPAYDDPNIITFGVFGKFEKRKHTDIVVKTLCKLYGNNKNYRVHCQITNNFVGRNPQEIEANNKQIWNNLTDNNKYFNVVSYPYLRTNDELNRLFNACDIVVDMSGAEGFSCPSFHCVGMGRHAIVCRNSGIEMWANEENAVCIKPNGQEPAYDGMFFHQGQPFNQGNIFTFSSEEFEEGLKLAEERVKKKRLNEAGLELQKKFTWAKTVDGLQLV